MGLYVEKFFRTRDDQECDLYEVYVQPAWRRVAGDVLSWASVKGDPLVHRLQPVADWVHERRCNGDCTTGVVNRRKPGPEHEGPVPWSDQEARKAFMAEHFTTAEETFCGQLPLCADIDVRLHYFGRKDREVLFEHEGPSRALERF